MRLGQGEGGQAAQPPIRPVFPRPGSGRSWKWKASRDSLPVFTGQGFRSSSSVLSLALAGSFDSMVVIGWNVAFGQKRRFG